MAATTRVLSNTTKSVDSETTTGLTVNLTQVTGARTKWTAKANSNGKMARCTLANLSTISVRDRELSFGLMVANILESGRLVNSTESVLT